MYQICYTPFLVYTFLFDAYIRHNRNLLFDLSFKKTPDACCSKSMFAMEYLKCDITFHPVMFFCVMR